jgi:hypothetical protein
LIREGAGQQLPVVFDFDNTIVCGDIGEATLAMLVRSGRLKAADLPPTLSRPFRPPGQETVSLAACADLTEYYEAFLAPTAHGRSDPTPLANGYVWAVEIMAGLSPLDVVRATGEAFALSQAAATQPCRIEVTPGRTGYPAPFFYAEMVDLIAELLRRRFDVWIVSASNVWSVRWMVLRALNPLLRQRGLRQGIRGDQVIGIATLLADRQGRLFKDSVLVREHAGYASLEDEALAAFSLTSRLQFPVPTYSGKVACLWDVVGRAPYLCAGDSPGDHAMMTFSRNRLWIARLEKPGYQRATAELVRKIGTGGWMVQPVLTKQTPGFVSDLSELARRLGKIPGEVREATAILSRPDHRLRATGCGRGQAMSSRAIKRTGKP